MNQCGKVSLRKNFIDFLKKGGKFLGKKKKNRYFADYQLAYYFILLGLSLDKKYFWFFSFEVENFYERNIQILCYLLLKIDHERNKFEKVRSNLVK